MKILSLTCISFFMLLNASAEIELSPKLTAVLQKRCIECHNAKKTKGKFNIEELLKNPHSAEKWLSVFDEVSEGNMPPEDEPQLSRQEKLDLLNNLPSFKAEKTTRLLTPGEINNSLIDFFKADADTFNAETLLAVNYSDESFFTQQRDMISPYYLDDLYKTLEGSINTLVHARKLPEPQTVDAVLSQSGHVARSVTIKQGGEKIKGGDLRWAWKSWSTGFNFTYPGMAQDNTLPPGVYELSFDISTPNYDKPIRKELAGAFKFLKEDKQFQVAVYTKSGDVLGSSKMIKVFKAPLEQERLTVRVEISRPSKISAGLLKGPTGGSFKYEVDKVYGTKGLWKDERYPLPCVRFLNVKITGPVALVKADTTIYENSLNKEAVKDKLALIQKKNFLPVDEDHFKSFLYFLSEGFSFEESYRKSILMFFMSSNFLNLKNSGDFSNRMRFASYSLMKSPPTKEFEAAYRKFMTDKDGKAFVTWMAENPKFRRFIEQFSRQWLHMDQINSNPPGKNRFPDYYNQKLSVSFPKETLAFMEHLFTANRPLDEIVTADYSFLNPSLHAYYKTGEDEAQLLARKTTYETLGEYEKYHFKDPSRGGLLPQGTFLTVNSNGVEELPIRRSVWILKNILNKSVPEPSNSVDIEQFETSKDLSFSKRLEIHRTNAQCASCHKRIDPLAVVMNSFDTIGQLKLTPEEKSKAPVSKDERKAGKAKTAKKGNEIYIVPTIEPYTVEYDGARISSVKDFKNYLRTKKEDIAAAFVSNLLKFTMGRELLVSDAVRIQKIVAENKENQFRTLDLFASLIREYFTEK